MITEILQLMLTKGIGNTKISKILEYIQLNPNTSIEYVCSDYSTLSTVINCDENTFELMVKNKENAIEIESKLNEDQIVVITKNDSNYPPQLIDSLKNNAPAVLFAKGNIDLLKEKAVGFCGSRNVSEKGFHITEECVKQLINHNISIVSGYANGTDIAAHNAAMTYGGNTVFVLAEGILTFNIKKTIKEHLTMNNHVFISQFLPTSVWSPSKAMQRNSVIIGLSRAMILVESRNTGGTYSAGIETLKRRLPLFVVDYQYPTVSSEANSFFIKRGGIPLRGKQGIPNIKNILDAVDNPQSLVANSSNTEQLIFKGFV